MQSRHQPSAAAGSSLRVSSPRGGGMRPDYKRKFGNFYYVTVIQMSNSIIAIFTLCLPVVFLGIYGIREYVLPALRTGILQARGRTYERSHHPFRFWGGIVFWFATLFIGIISLYAMVSRI
jgi:hypothetical protein